MGIFRSPAAAAGIAGADGDGLGPDSPPIPQGAAGLLASDSLACVGGVVVGPPAATAGSVACAAGDGRGRDSPPAPAAAAASGGVESAGASRACA